MAITDVAEYAHLSDAELEALAVDLDAIRRDIEDARGENDRAYILRAIAFQRFLDIAARLTIAASRSSFGWVLGAIALAAAKSIENMELGHNIGHGQWDWMNDPEIYSNTWEWDMAGVSSQWRYSHNYRHHVFTNVVGVDDDLGFGVLRVTRDQKWRRSNLYQPLRNVLLAIMFEWGIAAHGLHSAHERAATDVAKSAQTRALIRKTARQAGKDFVFFPALSLRRWRRTLAANMAANLLRNVWAYLVIACGHFPDGAEKFTPAALEGETKPEWYLRQMLGTSNFRAGPVLAFLSGNLCYQIEHHLFPDLPSNRYAEIAQRVRAVCDTYDLPYTTGPLARQYLLTFRTISKLAFPDRFLTATSDDAPETASEIKFRILDAPVVPGESNGAARRRGLVSAIRNRQIRRQARKFRVPRLPRMLINRAVLAMATRRRDRPVRGTFRGQP
ncbi:fatty acid desaturase [Mycobacterium simiae]|uniref:Fatty acid desaturase n=1 Tax=Mycobacterium simiae TaxID=1784 RepID=A0A5B1BTM3_MYCSI|nr:fatty acid desaturase [Mycobacterium simiae]KAA1251676.1 fatty acid desaturase [Mycobacterium simiae]